MAEHRLCLYVLSTETDGLGTRDCSSGRRNPLSQSTSGPFGSAWRSRDQGATLSFLIWQSIANFAPATWSNCESTIFARDPMCGAERQSSKRRQVDLSSSKSQSSREFPLRPGYQYFELQVLDSFSQVAFMQALTYPPANIPGWYIAGLKASAWSRPFMARTRCGVRRRPRFIAKLETCALLAR
jgi:hypothetical protein